MDAVTQPISRKLCDFLRNAQFHSCTQLRQLLALLCQGSLSYGRHGLREPFTHTGLPYGGRLYAAVFFHLVALLYCST